MNLDAPCRNTEAQQVYDKDAGFWLLGQFIRVRDLFGIPDWKCPPVDDVTWRYLDTSKVITRRPIAWPDAIAKEPMNIGQGTVPYAGSITGIPMQAASGKTTDAFLVSSPNHGKNRAVNLPRPDCGWYWVEGNPDRMGNSTVYDRHVCIIHRNGSVHEAIQTELLGGWVQEVGRFVGGQLKAGYPVTATGLSMAAYLLAANDPPHRLGAAVKDYYGGADGTAAGSVLRAGMTLALKPEAFERALPKLTPGGLWAATMLKERGVRILDKTGPGGGNGIGVQAGAFPSGFFGEWPFTLGDFDEAVG